MKFYIDNELIEQETVVGAPTVEDALQQVQEEYSRLGRMVVGVLCNGEEIPANEMAEMLKRPADSFERIDITTGTKNGLVIEAMSQATNCLDETEDKCKVIAELLKKGDTDDARKSLGGCLVVWQQIHEAVGKSIAMLDLDLESAKAGDENLLDVINRPKTALLEMRDALQATDYVLLADILEFEFTEAIESWRMIIVELQREAEGRKTEAERQSAS